MRLAPTPTRRLPSGVAALEKLPAKQRPVGVRLYGLGGGSVLELAETRFAREKTPAVAAERLPYAA